MWATNSYPLPHPATTVWLWMAVHKCARVFSRLTLGERDFIHNPQPLLLELSQILIKT